MTASVTRLSGQGCRHFLIGRCLYPEHVNPGLDEEFVCQVVRRLGRAFDAFVTRADNLGLTEEEAGRVWRDRFPATLAKEGNCQDYLPGGTTSFPDCAHAAGELCLLALPVCPGRCVRFFSRQG